MNEFCELENGITMSGPSELIEMTKEVFKKSREFNENSKYPPGSKVKICISMPELIIWIANGDTSEVDAYLIAKEIIDSVGEVINAEELTDPAGTYYTVSYFIYNCNQFFILPEHAIELVDSE